MHKGIPRAYAISEGVVSLAPLSMKEGGYARQRLCNEDSVVRANGQVCPFLLCPSEKGRIRGCPLVVRWSSVTEWDAMGATVSALCGKRLLEAARKAVS